MRSSVIPNDNSARPPARDEIRDESRLRRFARWMGLPRFRLVATVLVAIGVIWITERPFDSERAIWNHFMELGGRGKFVNVAPEWLTSIAGEHQYREVRIIDLAHCRSPEYYMDAVLDCRSLEILVVAGEQFTDEELKRLGSLHTLRGLIVDSTSVTQDGIAQLKQQLPELTVRVSSGLAVHRIRGVADVGWRRVDEESDVELPRNSAPSKYVGDEGDTLAGPEWLRELTPDFYFRDVESIEFRRRATRSHVENIRWLPHLRHVVLDECTLDDELLQLVASRAGVRQLDVRGGFNGELTTAGLRHLCKLPLRELRLGSLDLTNCDLSTLKSLRELHTLILDESHLTGEQLSELQQLDQLYSLRLIDARIPSGEWSRLENLPVEVLDLTGIWMAHEDFAFTHRMPNLQYLLLDNSGISDDQLAVIVKAKSLRGVGVSSTFITDTGVAAIAGMPELYEVDVSRTQVTEDGMKLLFRKDHRPLISADGIRMSPELSDQLGIGGGG